MPTHLIHRGLAKKNFKENTISAFKHCFKKNYGIETDIQCTKDDKIVCFHDFNLKKKFFVISNSCWICWACFRRLHNVFVN